MSEPSDNKVDKYDTVNKKNQVQKFANKTAPKEVFLNDFVPRLNSFGTN